MSVDISVIIPTFRRPGPLVEAIRSALDQPGVSVEVRVCDDSPEGSAREVVEGLGDRRVCYQHRTVPTGGNPGRVRNEGWPGTTGRVLHFLDDDDRMVAGAYAEALRAFEAHPEAGVVFGKIEPFGENPEVLEHERRGFTRAARRARLYQWIGSRYLFVANELYTVPTLFVNSACMIRREHVAGLGGYDEQLAIVEDLDFYLRAIRAHGCVFLDQPFLEYRTGTPSIMHSLTSSDPIAVSYQRIYRKYRSTYGAAELFSLKLLGKLLLRWL